MPAIPYISRLLIPIIALLLAILLPKAHGQIQISAKINRTLYLLYEPVRVEVSVTNVAGYDLLLEGDETRPWLSFLILRPDNSSIRPDQPYDFPPAELRPGQTRTFSINITPLYAFRDTGSYRVKAVVNVAGKQFITSPIEFSVANGHTVWKETRPVEGSDRTYSLIRFNYNSEATGLYLRVEDEKENLVYVTHPIGEIISFTDPRTAFDNEGRLHILHVIGKGQHRYTIASPAGVILNRDEYESLGEISPSLITMRDGSISVLGGKPRPAGERERLSETQMALAENALEFSEERTTASDKQKNKKSEKPKTKENREPLSVAQSEASTHEPLTPQQRKRQAADDTKLPLGRLF